MTNSPLSSDAVELESPADKSGSSVVDTASKVSSTRIENELDSRADSTARPSADDVATLSCKSRCLATVASDDDLKCTMVREPLIPPDGLSTSLEIEMKDFGCTR